MRTETFATPGHVALDIKLGSGEVEVEAAEVSETTVELDGHEETVEQARVETRPRGDGYEVIVDLSKATFIDSTTLGVLVGGVKRLRPAGGTLALVCSDQNIVKIFEITGLDRVFPIHATRDEALASLKQSGAA